MFKPLAASLAAALLANSAAAEPAPPAAPSQAIDAGVRPGDDFYAYANAVWLKSTPLPAGRASYDTTAMLRDGATQRIRDLVQGADATPNTDRDRRIGVFYASWADVDAIEAKGIAPLAADLAAVAAIRDRRDLAAYLGRSLSLDDGTNSRTDGLFGLWIHQGFHDGRRYAPHLVQGGLGHLDREAYLEGGAERTARLDLYRAHVAAILKLAGFDDSEARAGRVLALEAAIARAHAPRSHTDDVFKTDNAWRRADFTAKAPGLDWGAFFKAAGLAGQAEFIVWQPTAVTGAAALVGEQPIQTWQDYLAYRLVEHASGSLPKAFRDAEAAFAGASRDRTQEAVAATTAALGQDIGQLYVQRYFPAEAKIAAQAMTENLRSAFRARIARVTWMSPATREAALVKLAALKVGVGYPDSWIDYSGLEVRRGDAYGNLRRAEAFAYRRELAKLGRPVDPGEWSLLPQWPGAIINFSPNALQFSAGILQPPYFDAGGDAATNYGSAGAGMAHEISHSFDELGSIYDAEGRLGRWWTPADLAAHRAATAPLAAQFAADCPKPGLCLNGQQVLGEGVGDLAGLLVAYDAYQLSLGGKPDVVKEGLTGDQRFFLSFARRWRRQQTDAALERQVATDNHAPGAYRAGTVRHLEAWVRAFDVKPGDKLYLPPEDRAHIW